MKALTAMLAAMIIALVPAVNALSVDQVDQTLQKVNTDWVKPGDVFGVAAKPELTYVSETAKTVSQAENVRIELSRPDVAYSTFRNPGMWTIGKVINYQQPAKNVWYDLNTANHINAYRYQLYGKTVYLLMTSKDAPSEIQNKMVNETTYAWLKDRVTGKRFWINYGLANY